MTAIVDRWLPEDTGQPIVVSRPRGPACREIPPPGPDERIAVSAAVDAIERYLRWFASSQSERERTDHCGYPHETGAEAIDRLLPDTPSWRRSQICHLALGEAKRD